MHIKIQCDRGDISLNVNSRSPRPRSLTLTVTEKDLHPHGTGYKEVSLALSPTAIDELIGALQLIQD